MKTLLEHKDEYVSLFHAKFKTDPSHHQMELFDKLPYDVREVILEDLSGVEYSIEKFPEMVDRNELNSEEQRFYDLFEKVLGEPPNVVNIAAFRGMDDAGRSIAFGLLNSGKDAVNGVASILNNSDGVNETKD